MIKPGLDGSDHYAKGSNIAWRHYWLTNVMLDGGKFGPVRLARREMPVRKESRPDASISYVLWGRPSTFGVSPEFNGGCAVYADEPAPGGIDPSLTVFQTECCGAVLLHAGEPTHS